MIVAVSKLTAAPLRTTQPVSLEEARADLSMFQQTVFECLPDGVMILSERGQVIRTNAHARHICQQLNQSGSEDDRINDLLIPREIWRVCEHLIEYRESNTEYGLILDHVVAVEDANVVRIRAQWIDEVIELDADDQGNFYLMVILEDRNQSIHHLAIAATQQWGLTKREQDIWELHLQGYSYQMMAEALYIAKNTVKKHMKNILSKRRAAIGDERRN